jgi:hypothetical protein
MIMPSSVLEEKLIEAAPKVPRHVIQAAILTIQATESEPKDSSRIVVLHRAVRAIVQVLGSIDAGKVASASSDFEVLLFLLEEPGVLAKLTESDPLAGAKLRGMHAQMQLLKAEGGCVSAEEAGELIGIQKAAVHKARGEGRLLGLPRGQNHYLFPVWQFHDGQILEGLKQIYSALNCSPYMKASFMLAPNTRLNNETPIVVLRRGEVDKVAQAAQLYGEPGAV